MSTTNKAAAHTTGPWSVNGDNRTLIGGGDGRQMLAEALHDHVVKEWARPLAEAQANARLIAAAPELLAAAKQFTADYQSYIDSDDCELPDPSALLAAIERAEGGA